MRRDLPVPGSLKSKIKPEACESQAPPLLKSVTGLGRNSPLSITLGPSAGQRESAVRGGGSRTRTQKGADRAFVR